MRRMYSEQELTKVIKEVFEAELASGALDEQVSDAVDAYLLENPVDITALEGKTINPARIDVANINGETDPSVAPLYYHPIYIADYNEHVQITCLVLNNSATPFTWATFKAFIESGTFSLQPISGGAVLGTAKVALSRILHSAGKVFMYGLDVVTGDLFGADCTTKWDALFTGDLSNTQFEDSVNKIN